MASATESSSINQDDSPPSKRVCKPPRAERKGKKPSGAWDHFTRVMDSDGKTIKAICNYCGKEYAAGSKRFGTSNLLSHTPNCSKNPNKEEGDGQQTLGVHLKSGEGVELVATTFTFDAAKRALAEMIVHDELPFSFVEGYGFKKFCNVLQPKFYPIPSRTTITREVWHIFRNERDRLMKAMKGRRICFTTDTWTSIQNLCYMCLTAHYIDDDWKLQKRIINFCLVEDHKGETVGKKLETCLLDWSIDSIFTLTVDNASSNSLTIKFLVDATRDWPKTILDHEFLHVRYCAHILNLIVGDGLKEMDSSIANIRHAVRYVRSSPNRNDSFLKFVEKCKIESKSHLCLDVATRWNSTYLMLEHAEKFEKAFDRMGKDDGQFKAYFGDGEVGGGGRNIPTKDDWEKCRVFLKFLKLFYKATKKFSGSLYVTSNNFYGEMLVIQMKINAYMADDTPLLAKMARNMRAKFDKYWGIGDRFNLLLYVAVVLDPRNKMNFLEFSFKTVHGEEVAKKMKEKVSDTLSRLFDHYKNAYDSSIVVIPIENEVTTMVVDDDDDDPHSLIASQFNTYLEGEFLSNPLSELDKYLGDANEKIPPNVEFDILNWWKVNSSKYKVLSLLARDVLAMPVSTVASESAFSTGGRILDPFRSSLNPETVEMLVCTQNWLQSNIPISLRKAMDDVEQIEQSFIESSTCSSPAQNSSGVDVYSNACASKKRAASIITSTAAEWGTPEGVHGTKQRM